MHRYRYLLWLLWLLPRVLWSQQVRFAHYTVGDGLPSNTVYRVYRDRTGFLWMATDKGIARFNGTRFRKYGPEEGLPDNEVFFFQEDLQQRMWIGTFSGALCFYRNDTLFSAANTPYLNVGPLSTFASAFMAPDGSLTLLCGRDRFVRIRDTVIKVYPLPDGGSYAYVDWSVPGKFNAWTASARIVTDTQGHVLERRPFRGHMSYQYAIENSHKGNRMFLLNGSRVYDAQENLLFSFKKAPSHTYYFPQMKQVGSTFYVCTRNGLLGAQGDYLLEGIPVSGIETDINGDYWISTLNDGVYRMSRQPGAITSYTTPFDKEVLAACDRNDHILIALKDGALWRFDKQQGRSRCLVPGIRDGNTVNVPSIDPEGNYLLFSDAGKWLTLPGRRPLPLYGDTIFSFTKQLIPGGRSLYVVINDAIKEVDLAKLRQGRIKVTRAILRPDTIDRIYAAAYDSREGMLWFSTNKGMYRLSEQGASPQPAPDRLVLRKLFFKGRYMLGYTDKNELVVSDRDHSGGPAPHRIPVGNAGWSNIYSLNDTFLIATGNDYYYTICLGPQPDGSLCRISLLDNPQLPPRARYICSDGRYVYFFDKGTITRVAWETVAQGSQGAPRIMFTRVHTDGHSYLAGAPLTLSYKESRNIRIAFESLSFHSKVLSYEYALDAGGTSLQWNKIQGTEINIAAPSEGRYTLLVRCRDAAGNLSDTATLQLSVPAPLWSRWWFVGLGLLLAVALIAGVAWRLYRNALRRRHKQYLTDLRFRQLEFKSLNALMNPHFIFNSLNNIQGLINEDDKYAAHKYLAIFSGLIRQNMENIAREKISLQQELDLIRNYLRLEQLRFPGFSYTIDIKPGADAAGIMIPALLVQPLVENALKHGLIPQTTRERILSLSVTPSAGSLYICVTDNGVGMARGVQRPPGHQSLGLENIRARIEHMRLAEGRDIGLELSPAVPGDPASGTRACIRVGI